MSQNLTPEEWQKELQWATENGHEDYANQVREILGEDTAAPEPPPVDDGFSFGEMASNIPSSAAGVVGDVWQAVSNPIDTATAVGQAAMGGIQHLQDQFPESMQWMSPPVSGDYRPQATAVADTLTDRYGGKEAILNTLETDPVGVGSDLYGLVTGVSPSTAARINPVTRGASRLLNNASEGIMGSAAKFTKTISPDANDAMVRTMLERDIRPSTRGVAKLNKTIDTEIRAVDDLIAKANAGGGTVPIADVLQELGKLKEARGASLVSGGEDIAAINRFIDGVVDNAERLGKQNLTAADLQKMKRDLYDQIAWNARRQVNETPVLEDARKATARSAKTNIEQLAPGVKEANESLGALLELRPHLERSARRIDDRDIFGMTDTFALGSLLGGTGLGMPAIGAGLAAGIELFSNPKISPTVAQYIYRAGKTSGSASGQVAAALPYFGGSLYYAGERGALEPEEDEPSWDN
jgi:hypothetical protein